MDDEVAEALAAQAKRAALLALVAVAVSVLVLLIDNGIKKSVIEEAQKARLILDEFKAVAGEALNGAQAAGEAGVGPGDRVGNSDDVVHDAALGPDADQAPGNGVRSPGRRQARVAGGPRGDA